MKQTLDDFLECPICLDILKNPVLVVHLSGKNKCLHRFCRDCLKQLPKIQSNEKKCPGNFGMSLEIFLMMNLGN